MDFKKILVVIALILWVAMLFIHPPPIEISAHGIRLTSEVKIGAYALYVDEDGDLVAFNEDTETFSIVAYADYDSTTVPMEDVDESKMRLRNKQ